MNNKPFTLTQSDQDKSAYFSTEQLWKKVNKIKIITDKINALYDKNIKISDLLIFIKNAQVPVIKRITTADSPYTITNTDDVLIVNAAAGDTTVLLPDIDQSGLSNKGRILRIKKIDATANLVIVDGNGSETIDDETTQDIGVQYGSLSVINDGIEWWII